VSGRAFDVAILGGGPAGCATALSLARRAPALSVVLVEASTYATPRVGETLTPPAKGILDHLGVWTAFRACRPVEVHGTVAAWGSPEPHHNDYLFAARGPGWHVDRSVFDAMLAGEAERLGVTVLRGVSFTSAVVREDTWDLHLMGAAGVEAAFVVDATGTRSTFARRQGARSLELDRLVGFARVYERCGQGESHTLVESFSDGWWHSATLPGGRRVATCMTDSDLARDLGVGEVARWGRRLMETSLVAETVRGGYPTSGLMIRSARSARLDPPVGERWLAVGDAASSFDPLSSQGIVKGLRSGIFASYAVSDLLVGGDREGMSRYERWVADEFDAYCTTRSRYYALERRWPEREFWKRRAPLRGRRPRPDARVDQPLGPALRP
jgi:flavin-dependent dehydrogenase